MDKELEKVFLKQIADYKIKIEKALKVLDKNINDAEAQKALLNAAHGMKGDLCELSLEERS